MLHALTSAQEHHPAPRPPSAPDIRMHQCMETGPNQRLRSRSRNCVPHCPSSVLRTPSHAIAHNRTPRHLASSSRAIASQLLDIPGSNHAHPVAIRAWHITCSHRDPTRAEDATRTTPFSSSNHLQGLGRFERIAVSNTESLVVVRLDRNAGQAPLVFEVLEQAGLLGEVSENELEMVEPGA